MFLNSITRLSRQECVACCGSDLVVSAASPCGLEVIFFSGRILLVKDGSCLALGYGDLGGLKACADGGVIRVSCGGGEISYAADTGMQDAELDFVRAVTESFCDGIESSPRFMQDEAADFCGLERGSASSPVRLLRDMMVSHSSAVSGVLNRLSFGLEK